jgi:dsRNA-specific ribonuclease
MISDLIVQQPLLQISLHHISARSDTEKLLTNVGLSSLVLEHWQTVGKSLLQLYSASILIGTELSKDVGGASRALQLIAPQVSELIFKELTATGQIRYGPGVIQEEKNSQKLSHEIVCNFLGAYSYLNGYCETLTNILTVYSPSKNIYVTNEKDPKSILQELYQGKKLPIPIYTVVSVKGKQQSPLFEVEIKTCDKKSKIAVAGNRRLAEKNAATALINEYFPQLTKSKKVCVHTEFDIKKSSNNKITLQNSAAINELLLKLDLPSWSLNLLTLAFVHRSFNFVQAVPIFGRDNRLLALIGSYVMQWAGNDAVMRLIDHSEIKTLGGINNIKTLVFEEKNLANAMISFASSEIYMLGEGQKDDIPSSIHSEMMQAVVGVIYLAREWQVKDFESILRSFPSLLKNFHDIKHLIITKKDITNPKNNLLEDCQALQISITYQTEIKNSLHVEIEPKIKLRSNLVKNNLIVSLPRITSLAHKFEGKLQYENDLALMLQKSLDISAGKIPSGINLSKKTYVIEKWFLENMVLAAERSLIRNDKKLLSRLKQVEVLGISCLKKKDYINFSRWLDFVLNLVGKEIEIKIDKLPDFFRKVGSSAGRIYLHLNLLDDLEQLKTLLTNINPISQTINIKSSSEFKSLIQNATALRFMSNSFRQTTLEDLSNHATMLFRRRIIETNISFTKSISIFEIEGSHIALLDLFVQESARHNEKSISIFIEITEALLEITIEKNPDSDINYLSDLELTNTWKTLNFLLPIVKVVESQNNIKIWIPCLHDNLLALRCWWSYNLPTSTNLSANNTMANLLHDMKNEILAVAATSELIKKNTINSEIYQLAANASRHVEKALSKIGSAKLLIDSSKSTSIEALSVTTFVRSLISELWTFLPNNIQLIPPELATDTTIYTSAEALRSILLNLIRNAIDSMTNGGRLEIEYMLDNRNLEFEISDTGPGFTDSQLNSLNMGVPITSTKIGGSGVGLLTVIMLSKDLGGTIIFKKNTRGGSLVTLNLPSLEPTSDDILENLNGAYSNNYEEIIIE